MTIADLRRSLESGAHPRMRLPDGALVPAHFHLTEFGVVTKAFVDCGGTFRRERKATLQLWTSVDVDHRLSRERLLEILALGSHFDADGLEVQVEVQGGATIEVYGLEAGDGGQLRLTGTQTACLAGVACGLPLPVQAAAQTVGRAFDNPAQSAAVCCTPESGCC